MKRKRKRSDAQREADRRYEPTRTTRVIGLRLNDAQIKMLEAMRRQGEGHTAVIVRKLKLQP